MSNAAEVIASLIDQGRKFTWANVGPKHMVGQSQFLSSPAPDWIAWTVRVKNTIEANFDSGSAAVANLDFALRSKLVGNRSEKFAETRDQFLAALERGQEILKVDTFDELLKREKAVAPKDLSNRVFIVHGHDDAAKNELEIMLRDMGLEPVVLHRKPDEGRTVIEKFEAHADVGFAFILLTPDEVAYLAADEAKADRDRSKERRARPNVIWEFGYFVGKLSRARTCCLYRGDVTLPSDLDGLIYKSFTKSVEEQGWAIQKELKAAGYVLK